jgi:hypothetical protein
MEEDQMSKHTPRPWRTHLTDDTLVIDAFGVPVATMDGNYVDGSHAYMEANARLIAAAPDLLEALAPFAEFARMMDEIEHVQKTPDDAVIHPGLTVGHFRQARAAIAKAKGEA